jgi:RHS repeat-associated protein
VRSGPKGAASEVRSFSYDAAQSRVRERTQTGDEAVTLGDVFRRAVGAAGTRQYAARLPVLAGLVVELVEEGSGVQARFSTTDRLGSVIHVADQQRNELERREYEPYGKSSSSLTTRAGFTGHDSDVELGLINMKGRLYDPGIGRFLSPDPIVAAAGDTQAWNRYSYIWNSPLNGTDPSGFDPAGGCPFAVGCVDTGGEKPFPAKIGGTYGQGMPSGNGTTAQTGPNGQPGTGTASSSDLSSFSTAVSSLTTAVFAALTLPLAPLPSGAAIHWTPSHTLQRSVGPADAAIAALSAPAPWQAWATLAIQRIDASLAAQNARGVRPGAEAIRYTIDVLARFAYQLIEETGPDQVLTEIASRGAAPMMPGVGGVGSASGSVRAAPTVSVGPRSISPSGLTRTETLRSQANVTRLAENMKVGGWQGDPIKVFEHNGTKYILDGHHRAAAARRAGIDVLYESVGMDTLRSYGYRSVDELIWSAAEAGGGR